MKVQGNDNHFNLFINNNKDYIFDTKEITAKNIKEIIVKLIKYYNFDIKGLYNIKIYQNKRLGFIIEGEKKDDYNFSNIIDLNLTIIKDYDFLFKCEDYFKIDKYKNKFYYDNNYYISIDDIEDILDVIEYVEIVYGDKKDQIIERLIEI